MGRDCEHTRTIADIRWLIELYRAVKCHDAPVIITQEALSALVWLVSFFLPE